VSTLGAENVGGGAGAIGGASADSVGGATVGADVEVGDGDGVRVAGYSTDRICSSGGVGARTAAARPTTEARDLGGIAEVVCTLAAACGGTVATVARFARTTELPETGAAMDGRPTVPPSGAGGCAGGCAGAPRGSGARWAVVMPGSGGNGSAAGRVAGDNPRAATHA